MEPNRIAAIDALRGAGAMAVAIMHVYYLLGVSQHLPDIGFIVTHFSAGVMLFFVVSAFTLCLTYEQKEANRHARTFLIKRYFRIAPLFYLCILLTWIILSIKGTTFVNDYSVTSVLANLCLVFNLFPSVQMASSLTGAGWTIGVEFIFYFLFPWLAPLLKRPGWLLVLFGVALLAAIYSRSSAKDVYWINFSIVAHMPTFLAGMLLYLVWKVARTWETAIQDRVGAALGVMFLASAITIIWKPPAGWIMHLAWSGAFLFLTLSLLLRPIGLFTNRTALFLGKVSYSIYLLHPVVITIQSSWFGKVLPMRALIIYASVFGLLLPVAWLSFTFIEEPFNALARRLTSRLLGRDRTKPAIAAATP